jgi:DNA mismatch repair protein MutS2
LIPALNQRGTLLGPPDDGKAQVQIGAMRMTVPYASLQRLLRAGAPAPKSQPRDGGSLSQMQTQARATISPEVHLRGMRAEEALRALDEYIDSACLAGVSPVRVVHGKGTGALKKAVWDYVKTHPNVAGYRLGEEGEGGDGVTVVDLRE